jgi:hypothetical protein
MAETEDKADRFDELIAELNNCVTSAFGLGSLLAYEHAPDLMGALSRDLERYRRLVAELREVHHRARPE